MSRASTPSPPLCALESAIKPAHHTNPSRSGVHNDKHSVLPDDAPNGNSHVQAKRKSLRTATLALDKCMRYEFLLGHAESEKGKAQIKAGRAILHAELKRAFSQAPADFRKLLSVRNSNRREKGLHSLDEGGKLGESTDMDDRTARQKYITMEVIMYQFEIIRKGYASKKAVDGLMELDLPMLKGCAEC